MTPVEEVTRNDGRMDAATMAYAVAADPQFVPPVRPCLAAGLVQVPLVDGIAFPGTGNRQTVLRGRSAVQLIPRLLPLLDGTRTVEELGELLPRVPLKTLHACVSLLYVSGLLQDGPIGEAVEVIPAEVAGYLGRNLDTTRVNRSRNQACERLARTRVLIAGTGPLAAMLRTELAGAGADAHAWTGDALTTGDLVVAVDDGNTTALTEVEEACRKAGIGWLRTAVGADRAEIGPLFDARYSCCYDCFARNRTAPAGEPSAVRAAIWAALAATETVHLLARVGEVPSMQVCTVYDLGEWSRQVIGAYRRPGCPTCLPADPRAETDRSPLAHRYEQAVTFPPREWLNLKEHQAHYRPANHALQRYNKQYQAAARLPLGDGSLSHLLRRTAGLRDLGDRALPGQVSRWSPTGGNLGSVQAYLLALDVDGLDPAWYFYQRADHTLGRVRAATAGVCPALEETGPSALLVLTGALGVVAAKYHDFAYRILGLDAGVALAQLSAVAATRGVTTRFAARWDDAAFHDALRLDPDAEPVTAVVALGGLR
ncbi:nitroreductase family protein [Actinoplanes sp. HUAS TT8]|uniref:nitroreductase family protein n=1 Tax=Actinoplanes sp. HUAS TT8 TaxID=3447453 RepID=UPI003F51AE7F